MILNTPRLINGIYDPMIQWQIDKTQIESKNSQEINKIIMYIMIVVSVLSIALIFPIKYKLIK